MTYLLCHETLFHYTLAVLKHSSSCVSKHINKIVVRQCFETFTHYPSLTERQNTIREAKHIIRSEKTSPQDKLRIGRRYGEITSKKIAHASPYRTPTSGERPGQTKSQMGGYFYRGCRQAVVMDSKEQ